MSLPDNTTEGRRKLLDEAQEFIGDFSIPSDMPSCVNALHKDDDETTETTDAAELHDYETGVYLGLATVEQAAASREAAQSDGGCGVIYLHGRRCYVVD